MRLVSALALLLAFPVVAQAQEDIDVPNTVYAVSNVQNQLWLFDRNNPVPTRQTIGLPLYAMTIAYDPLTNHLFVRSGGAGSDAYTYVSCLDATTLENLGYIDDEVNPGCGFPTPGTAADPQSVASGSITIDPYMRVLYSDGGNAEVDNCTDANPNHDSRGAVFAYSLVPANYGALIGIVQDNAGAHSVTDGSHLIFDPTDRRLWSAPSEWTDNIRPRYIDVGTIQARGGEFGDVTVTNLPTFNPAGSIGVDPDHRRIFLIPWNPPTHHHPKEPTLGMVDHPEAQYVHVYNMDTYAEIGVLDYRTPPAACDTVSHCGYNVDFKLWYDRVANRLYETNFWETRGMFYDLDANTVEEAPIGEMRDVYGFTADLPESFFEPDYDGDGILDSIEVGATDLLEANRNDADPSNRPTSPYLADTDGGGVGDGTEDANHNGRQDDGETNPADPTDDPGGDYDRDGAANESDNCRAIANADQADDDNNGIGNACEGLDRDHDGIPDDLDNCDCLPNPDQADICTETDQDGDGVEDTVDNCDCTPNPDQTDIAPEDGVGDVCQFDTDGDGLPDDRDNCPTVPNPDQLNTCGDENTPGDACDSDIDEDTIFDACDNCPDVPNTDQVDLDADGVGAACSPKPSTCACSAPGLPEGSAALAALASLLLLGLLVTRRRR